jgi:hypothetical protein
MKWQIQTQSRVTLHTNELSNLETDMVLETTDSFPSNAFIVEKELLAPIPQGPKAACVDLFLTLEVEATFPEMTLGRVHENIRLVSKKTSTWYSLDTYQVTCKTEI